MELAVPEVTGFARRAKKRGCEANFSPLQTDSPAPSHSGVGCASADAMGVRRFEDLVAWQLARELSLEVFAVTETGRASRDFRFRDQLRDSAASVERNIAEGFGRSSPGDFARFLRYARGSLAETRNTLIEGRDRGYLASTLADRLLNLASATDRLTKNLMLAKLRQAGSMKANPASGK